MSTGRKKDPIWNYFEEKHEIGKKGSKAKCIKCGKVMQGLVSRMRNHESSCSIQENVLLSVDEIHETEVSEVELDQQLVLAGTGPSTGKRKSVLTSRSPPRLDKKIKNSKLDSYVSKTSSDFKKKLDCQIARYIYSTNSAFRCVENPEFKKTIEMLRPGYVPPSKTDVGNRLLDTVYEEESEKCALKLSGQTVCMCMDGWSNIHNEPIVCACLTTSKGEVYLVDTVDTSGKPHTCEYLTELAIDIVKKAQKKFQCKIRSFVTDNAANMAKMRSEMDKLEAIDVITYGCSAHLLNLLAKDLEIPNVTEHVIQIIKYFRNNHFARAKFTECKVTGLIIPQEVRWNTMCDSLESYVKNWPILMKIAEENRDTIDQKIKAKILNVSIKRNAEDLLLRLKPISVALDRVQRDNCSISKAVEVWKILEGELKERTTNTSCMNFFTKRYIQSITPAHFLAFLLNPNMDPGVLTVEEKEKAIGFAQDKYGNSSLMTIILKFLARADPFNGAIFEPNLMKTSCPLEWWKSVAIIKECVSVREMEIIQQLLTAKATSAGVERMFSSFGLVHSKLRNHLGVEKAAKLVFLMRVLNEK